MAHGGTLPVVSGPEFRRSSSSQPGAETAWDVPCSEKSCCLGRKARKAAGRLQAGKHRQGTQIATLQPADFMGGGELAVFLLFSPRRLRVHGFGFYEPKVSLQSEDQGQALPDSQLPRDPGCQGVLWAPVECRDTLQCV